MKKAAFFLFFLLNSFVLIFAQDETDDIPENVPPVEFRIFADFFASPFFWEGTKEMGVFALNGSLMGGAVWKEKTFGLQFDINYDSFASLSSSNDNMLEGAFTIFRGSAVAYIPLLPFMEIKGSIGGAFLSTAFRYQADRNIHQYWGGPSFGFDMFLRIPSFRYAELKLINRLDFMISENSEMRPYYYAGARINFFPYVKWLKLYTELGVMPWFYGDEQVDVNTAMFVWSVGISFDARIPSSFRRKKKAKPVEPVPEPIVVEEVKEVPPVVPMDKKTRLKYIEIIEELEDFYGNARVLAFRNVLFQPNKAELADAAQIDVLQEIADMLLKYDNVFINICGYTNDTGEQYLEKVLSEERAEYVVKFMEDRGIAPEKMTLAGRGSSGLKVKAIDDINRRVELRVLMRVDPEE